MNELFACCPHCSDYNPAVVRFEHRVPCADCGQRFSFETIAKVTSA